MSIDPKTTTSSSLKGKILGSALFTPNSNQPWYANKIFLGSALFSTVGGAVGFVSAKVVAGEHNFQDDQVVVNSADLLNVDGDSTEIKNNDNSPEGLHIDFTSSLPCGHPDDNLAFGPAFKSQRELMGQGGVFEYHGKYYNTFYKEEWDSMSEGQKHDYYLAIDSKIDYDKSIIVSSSREVNHPPSVAEHNEGMAMHDPSIPESQADEFISFEYGHGALESGPGSAHLDPEMDVPATIIVSSFGFHNEGDDDYEHIEHNITQGSNNLMSDNSMDAEEIHNYANTIDLDSEHIVDVNKMHLAQGNEEITLVDHNDTHHHYYTDVDDLFDTKIVENDHHLDTGHEDFHSHE